MERANGDYELSDEKSRLDLATVHRLLSQTYWAANRSRKVQDQAIRNSVCLGLFHRGEQVGFCRAVTDHATFSWICDVIIHPAHRGKGLGKWMVQCLCDHADLQTRSQVLATRDAHKLYTRFGFCPAEYLKRALAPAADDCAKTSVP